MALGSLVMRRAVMNAIPLMLVDAAGIHSSDKPSSPTAFADLGQLGSHLDDPKQLLQLLKLANAAGGAGAKALFDSLRTLLTALPPAMANLPELLVADALEHIRKCVDASDTVDSLHPLGNRGEQREVQRIHIPGANAIRIDADARCELPAKSTLYISPTPTQAQAVRTIKGSEQAKASEGGWMPIVVPGDTAYVIYQPNRPMGADKQTAWGWRIRAAAESYRSLSEEETYARLYLLVGRCYSCFLTQSRKRSQSLRSTIRCFTHCAIQTIQRSPPHAHYCFV